MAVRKVHNGVYASDILATNFVRKVDDHFFTQSAVLGWNGYTGSPALFPVPRGVRCRHAVGVDTSGRRHAVVVAQTTADLWTRASITWTILDDTGTLDTVTLTGLVGEAVTIAGSD